MVQTEIKERRREYIQRLISRRRAFKSLFLDENNRLKPDAKMVMSELAAFCYAGKPSHKISRNGTIDPYATHVAEGRREVYLRIVAMLANDTDFHRALELMDKPEDY